MRHAVAIPVVTVAAVVMACGCGKSAREPVALAVVADIAGDATLVPGTRRFALRIGTDGWWISEAGTLVEQPDIGAAIAKTTTSDSSDAADAHFDIFLGTTPILFGGAEHGEHIVRLGPTHEVDAHIEPLEVAVIGKHEVWRVREGIFEKVAFVDDTRVEPAPPLALIGPPADTTSPVSAKLCGTPKVEDIATLGDEVYALVTECHDDAPMRIVSYPSGRVAMLPSRKRLDISSAKLVVSRDGKLHLAGIHDGYFHVENVLDDMTFHRSSMITTFRATRLETSVVADDGAFWALVLDAAGKPQIIRAGSHVPLAGTPKGLALDDKLGVVVLTANSLLAEHPGRHVVIAPRR